MLDKVEAIVSPVYQVGGSVRDELLGKEPKDFDYATPLDNIRNWHEVRENGPATRRVP